MSGICERLGVKFPGPARNRSTGTGSKPPSAAVVKSHGREHRRKRPGKGPGQVTGKKRTARELLWKCRKQRDDVKTAGGLLLRDQAPTKPVYGRSGIRHERWPELAKEAVERNVGT